MRKAPRHQPRRSSFFPPSPGASTSATTAWTRRDRCGTAAATPPACAARTDAPHTRGRAVHRTLNRRIRRAATRGVRAARVAVVAVDAATADHRSEDDADHGAHTSAATVAAGTRTRTTTKDRTLVLRRRRRRGRRRFRRRGYRGFDVGRAGALRDDGHVGNLLDDVG